MKKKMLEVTDVKLRTKEANQSHSGGRYVQKTGQKVTVSVNSSQLTNVGQSCAPQGSIGGKHTVTGNERALIKALTRKDFFVPGLTHHPLPPKERRPTLCNKQQ